MKRNIISAMLFMMSITIFRQVGIDTANPQATLDVVGKPADISKFDGVIPPRITGDQLNCQNLLCLLR